MPRDETSATLAITGFPTATVNIQSIISVKGDEKEKLLISDCATAIELIKACSPKYEVANVRYA